jgi:ABC-type bacteriocin/lantibiotic exporter with double-glycine peptidase domain
VLLLDEATNALDVATERRILDALFALRPRKTIIIISHRPWLADLCDTVLVFDGGTVSPSSPSMLQ